MTDPTHDPDKDPNQENAQETPEELDTDWAAALSEQAAGTQGTQADGLKSDMDDWAAALAEQTAATQSQTDDTAEDASAQDNPATEQAETSASEQGLDPNLARPAAEQVFQPLSSATTGVGSDIDMIMDIPVQLTVELGRTKLTIKNILQLGQGSIVELDGLAGEPMDIFVNGYLIAQGEVVVVDDKYGIRLTDIITPSDRLHRLNSRR
ncbi:MAG: flagellar motor switch protein FliN [Alcaligenaceae bacterium]|jgi:flagellar motor switch protein FliN/FliY|nr:flagellar motor switch protein FliN [Alcaligenaceae bacterium]